MSSTRNSLRQRLAALEAALALWAGSPLADLADEEIGAARDPLGSTARGWSALELRNDAQLAVGESDELVGGLTALIANIPTASGCTPPAHVLALYRAGRQKDALDAYRSARATLVDELGIEPGPELR